MLKEFKVDNLKVNVYGDRKDMGEEAAKMVAEKIKSLLLSKNEVNMIFAAAPSQNEFLTALVNNEDVEWNKVNAFHMDEYVGLPEDAPQGFGNFLKEKIFAKVPFHSIHYLRGNASDADGECERYSGLLKKFPTDIVCMGIGENTHLAFNDPHVADFNDIPYVKVVDLDNACRQQQVNDNCFAQLMDVPTHALTLTIPALMVADNIYCVVPGANKSDAIFHTLNEEISSQYPSTILRKHHNSILFLDADSSSRIGNLIPNF
ncbi:MAG: glucosamine-6-phosphate deaminase [Ginsengibacter sp.]